MNHNTKINYGYSVKKQTIASLMFMGFKRMLMGSNDHKIQSLLRFGAVKKCYKPGEVGKVICCLK